MERRNFVSFVCGMRGSGKSVLCAKHSALFPRRIVHDPLGEYVGKIRGAVEVASWRDLLAALDEVAGEKHWTVTAMLDPDVIPRLAGILAPVGNVNGGYSRAVGGVALECGEVDTIAPNSAAIDARVRNLFQRGRHYRVSVICATQRPRDVHRVVTSQADALCAFRQHEPRDVSYLAEVTSEALAARVPKLAPFHHLEYLPGRGLARIVGPDGATLARLDPYSGEEL